MVQFAKAKMVGGRMVVTIVKEISSDQLFACPHAIFDPQHFRKDGSCRCNDRNDKNMKKWGYVWKDGQWRGNDDV